MRAIPGFEMVQEGGARALARPEAEPWVRQVLEGGRSLHGDAAQDAAALELAGRAPVFVVAARTFRRGAAQGAPLWAVRHYARGGWLLPALLGDRYLRGGVPRPLREVEASEAARARGVPTPRILAAVLYTGTLFYRGDLVTEFVPGATPLGESLFADLRKGLGGAMERREALQAAGELVRLLAAQGVHAPDLHAGNVLLEWAGSAPRPHLLDLDRCRILPEGARASAASMLARLRRSLKKWERRSGFRLAAGEWRVLEEAAMG